VPFRSRLLDAVVNLDTVSSWSRRQGPGMLDIKSLNQSSSLSSWSNPASVLGFGILEISSWTRTQSMTKVVMIPVASVMNSYFNFSKYILHISYPQPPDIHWGIWSEAKVTITCAAGKFRFGTTFSAEHAYQEFLLNTTYISDSFCGSAPSKAHTKPHTPLTLGKWSCFRHIHSYAYAFNDGNVIFHASTRNSRYVDTADPEGVVYNSPGVQSQFTILGLGSLSIQSPMWPESTDLTLLADYSLHRCTRMISSLFTSWCYPRN